LGSVQFLDAVSHLRPNMVARLIAFNFEAIRRAPEQSLRLSNHLVYGARGHGFRWPVVS
jgi:hypothetical protein